jgi:hypothetical protein
MDPSLNTAQEGIRLLEQPSDDPIRWVVADILWEMVEIVNQFDIVPADIRDDPNHGCSIVRLNEIDRLYREAEERDRLLSEGTPVFGQRICGRCAHSEQVIESRGFGWEDYLELRDLGEGAGEELICRSCVATDLTGNGGYEFYCSDCGYSETLCKQYHGEQLGLFYLEGQARPAYQDENTRCQGCRARVERWESSEVARTLFPESDEAFSVDRDTYDGELELVDEDEDEDEDGDGEGEDEEKPHRVKKTVQEMGGILFDIKDKITEGEYLQLMNGLQSITNEMNH